MAIIGIDLGTTNSLVSVWKNGKVEIIPDYMGNVLQPSVVAIDETGHLLTSWAAKEEMTRNPERGVAGFKRSMGTTQKYELDGREYRSEELSAIILRRLKEMAQDYLQEEVTEAVISVPAYFDNEQRYATKDAARLAGIKCERILNEPSAAALATKISYGYDDEYMLVFDFGGGTLDVSIVECFEDIIEIKAIAGDNQLGGRDFDKAIAKLFCARNGISWESLNRETKQLLCIKSQEIKETLTYQKQAIMKSEIEGQEAELLIDSIMLYEAGREIFERIKNVIQNAVSNSHLRMADISKVLLVGGSSKMPTVQKYLCKLFGREVEITGDVEQLVAMGVGIYAAVKSRQTDVQNVVMTDVCPFSLGTAVHAPYSPETKYVKNYIMIEKNSVLPTRVTQDFYTIKDDQKVIDFEVYQGDKFDPRENIFLGKFEINVPPDLAGNQSITVTYTYDLNGLLIVEAFCNANGEKREIMISGRNNRIKQNKLKSMGEALKNLEYLSEEEMQQKTIENMALRLYEKSTGKLRNYIDNMLSYYMETKSAGSLIITRKANRKVLQNLLRIEFLLKQNALQDDVLQQILDEETREENIDDDN